MQIKLKVIIKKMMKIFGIADIKVETTLAALYTY
jgi:hypothetical protein